MSQKEPITIPRPQKKFKSKSSDRYYIKVNGKRIMLDQSDVDDWDTILMLTIDSVTYTQRTMTGADEPGKFKKVGTAEDAVVGDLIEDEWDRDEIVDYTTTTREFTLLDHEQKVGELRKKIGGTVNVTNAVMEAVGKQL